MSIPDLMSFLADSLSVIGVIATIFGVSTSLLGGNLNGNSISFNFFGSSGHSVSVASIPIAVRLMFILLICSSIGWAFGALSRRLTAQPSESSHVISNIGAVFFALVLVASTELLSNGNSKAVLPEFQFFTLVGLVIVILICRFQYRTVQQAPTSTVVINRSLGLLLFVFASLVLMFLLELT